MRADAARHRSTDLTTLEEVARPSPDDAFQFDVRPLLHEELNRLPDKFRDPIVLCHLEVNRTRRRRGCWNGPSARSAAGSREAGRSCGRDWNAVA